MHFILEMANSRSVTFCLKHDNNLGWWLYRDYVWGQDTTNGV